MLGEEDQNLFLVARQAQVNRNTAIHMLESPDAREIIKGVFVRVLLELPTRQEDYVVARVVGLMEGEPYSGFSTIPGQTTTTHLVLHLPPELAAINGTQYQLNSVSNSMMREAEFSRWLTDTRAEDANLLPTHDQLMVCVTRVRSAVASLSLSRQRRNSSAGTLRAAQQQPYGGVSPTNANISASHASLHPPSTQFPVPRQQAIPANNNPAGAAGMNGQLSMPPSSAPPAPSQALPVSRKGTSMRSLPPPLSPQQHPARYASTNDVLVSASVDSALTAATAPHAAIPASAQSLLNGSAASPSNAAAVAAAIATGGVPQAAQRPFSSSVFAAAEEEELMRRLRQEVMNQLSQKFVLFPRDPGEYKLSRLRVVERDMLEYLHQVREEKDNKHENCVVCLGNVPTVILLPCKHKVMCRLCAPSCSCCPVCRSDIKEMFEPQEV